MLRKLLSILAAALGVASGPAQSQDGGWAVGKAEDDGKPLLIRYRETPPAWVNRSTLPKLVAITWKLANPGGLPTREESERTYDFEDTVSAAVESARLGVLTLIVTGNGTVEWQFYAANHEEFMKTLNQALASKPKLPIAIALQDDPEWSAYKRFSSKP